METVRLQNATNIPRCLSLATNHSVAEELGAPITRGEERLILTSFSKIKDALFFKMFIYMYKKDFPKKNIFFFALTGRPEAIYFAL